MKNNNAWIETFRRCELKYTKLVERTLQCVAFGGIFAIVASLIYLDLRYVILPVYNTSGYTPPNDINWDVWFDAGKQLDRSCMAVGIFTLLLIHVALGMGIVAGLLWCMIELPVYLCTWWHMRNDRNKKRSNKTKHERRLLQQFGL